jgi:hypothetical protein
VSGLPHFTEASGMLELALLRGSIERMSTEVPP